MWKDWRRPLLVPRTLDVEGRASRHFVAEINIELVLARGRRIDRDRAEEVWWVLIMSVLYRGFLVELLIQTAWFHCKSLGINSSGRAAPKNLVGSMWEARLQRYAQHCGQGLSPWPEDKPLLHYASQTNQRRTCVLVMLLCKNSNDTEMSRKPNKCPTNRLPMSQAKYYKRRCRHPLPPAPASGDEATDDHCSLPSLL
jgi:hypothetical protein